MVAVETWKVWSKDKAPNAPGMLAKHYAPTTKTYLVDDAIEFAQQFTDQRIGLLRLSPIVDPVNFQHIEVLSSSGDLHEATANLYKALHHLDSLNLDIIIAERLPEQGLGKSINDRLERAAN